MVKQIIVLSFCTMILICSATFSAARETVSGVQCPPGWTEKTEIKDVNLLKKCISPARKAFIELYMYPEMGVSLSQLLNGWTNEMSRKGMPFKTLVSETLTHVSGYPAVSRTYSGSTGSGIDYTSTVTACLYKNKNYILLGMHRTGHQKSRQEVGHAVSTWFFPKQDNTKLPVAGDSGKFKNIGSCWAWGLWKDASGRSVLIIPDGQIIFNGHQFRRWRPQDEDSIVVELPTDQGGGTAIWSHPEGRNDALTKTEMLNEQPDIKPILLRVSWEYRYKGKSFTACQQ